MTAGPATDILLWLATYALHSTLFLGAVWLFERIWRRASPSLANALWRTALVAGIVTASLQSLGLVPPVASRLSVAVTPAATELDENPVAVSAQPAAASTSIGVIPAERSERRDPLVGLSEPQSGSRTALRASGMTTVEGDERGQGSLSPPADNPNAWTEAVLAAWAAIAAILAFRAVLMWSAAHRELRDRQPVVQGPLFERIQALAHDIGLRRLPQVSFSTRIAGPFTLPNGEICIPVWAREKLPQRQLDAMLAHEMAHVLHRDSLWLAIGMAVGTVFFFQPLNSLARRRLAHLAEFSADDWAATRAGSGRPLAECISSFVDIAHEKARAMAAPEFAAAMAKPKSELVRRVERLLNNRYTSGVLPMRSRLLIGACAFAFGAALPGIAAQAHAPQSPHEAPLESPLAPQPPVAADLAQAPEIPPAPQLPAAAEVPTTPDLARAPEVPALQPAPAPEPQRNVHISSDDGRVRITIDTRGLDYGLKVSADGAISLAPDGSGVTRIGNGGFLDATLDKGGQSRRVRFTGESGGVQRQFWVGGQSRPWGAEADGFVSELMPILFRETGLSTRERVEWLLRQRGPDGLFAEIGHIERDAVQTGYIMRWLDAATLAPAMLERVMELASREIESDAHLQAALDKVFETQKPAGRTLIALLRAGESIDSDAHVTALLNTVGNAALNADDTASAYYQLTRSIDSDAHMLAVLTPLVENAATSEARIGETLKLGAADINSDAHLSALLEAAAPRVRNSDALARAYLEAASTIQSDAHDAAVLSKLAEKAQLSPQGWRDLLGAAARLRSDAHKAALLSSLAGRIRQPDLVAAWRAAVDTIGSDSHRRATERALPS